MALLLHQCLYAQDALFPIRHPAAKRAYPLRVGAGYGLRSHFIRACGIILVIVLQVARCVEILIGSSRIDYMGTLIDTPPSTGK